MNLLAQLPSVLTPAVQSPKQSYTSSGLRSLLSPKKPDPNVSFVLAVDTQVQCIRMGRHQRHFRRATTFSGRGGTRFAPAFEHLNDSMHDIEACVYLTDLGSMILVTNPTILCYG